MPRIIQIVRYVEYAGSAGPGTVALDDSGKLYRIMEHGLAGKWVEMVVPSLPDAIDLRPLQKASLDNLSLGIGVIDADQPGLGKTILAAKQAVKSKR